MQSLTQLWEAVPMRPFFRAKDGGHWTHTPHKWVAFVREIRILTICFHRYTWNLVPKYFFSLYVSLFPFIHIRSSCFEYKCP